MENNAEKKVRERGRNFNISEFTDKVRNGMGKLETTIDEMGDNLRKIYHPVAIKDVTLDGNKCAMSLIEDGRVFIQFPAQGTAEAYFADTPVYRAKEVNDQCKEEHKKGYDEADTKWKNKSIWARLWKI